MKKFMMAFAMLIGVIFTVNADENVVVTNVTHNYGKIEVTIEMTSSAKEAYERVNFKVIPNKENPDIKEGVKYGSVVSVTPSVTVTFTCESGDRCQKYDFDVQTVKTESKK